MQAADLGPIPDAEKTQSPLDLFLIIAGANLVATTLQTGASLAPAFGLWQAAPLAVAGVVLGTALVAALTPLGPRLGVPSVIACRAALGLRGGALVSLLLYVTNFAWIAVNNVIAASACARALRRARERAVLGPRSRPPRDRRRRGRARAPSATRTASRCRSSSSSAASSRSRSSASRPRSRPRPETAR